MCRKKYNFDISALGGFNVLILYHCSTISVVKENTSTFIAHRSSKVHTVKEVLTELSKRKIRPTYGTDYTYLSCVTKYTNKMYSSDLAFVFIIMNS
jgi:hypothetical protein